VTAALFAAAYGIGYVYVGWAAVIGGGIAYAASVIQRGRRMAKQVPDGRRRWSDPG
jgi:hypothetical protein